MTGCKVLTVGVFSVALLSSSSQGASDRGPTTSLIRLIATPEKYQGKLIRTEGFVSLDHEFTAVFISESDYRRGLSANGISLTMTEAEKAKFRAADKQYCWVVGILERRSGQKGNFSGNVVAIRDIEKIPNMGD
jgi:hypothetical protein